MLIAIDHGNKQIKTSSKIFTSGYREPEITDEMNFDEAVESLGSNGFDAVAATLNLFRKK